MPTIALCVHRITHRMTDGWHRSKDVELIMLSGWMTTSGGVRGSQRCKAKWMYWMVTGPPVTAAEVTMQAEHWLNLVRSRETDWENGYENRSPVFSYERSPT